MEPGKSHGRKKKKKGNYLLFLFFELMNKHKSKNVSIKNCFDDDSNGNTPDLTTLKSTITSYSFENPFPHIRNSNHYENVFIAPQPRRIGLDSSAYNQNTPPDHVISQQLLDSLNFRANQKKAEIQKQIDYEGKISHRNGLNYDPDIVPFPTVPIERSCRKNSYGNNRRSLNETGTLEVGQEETLKVMRWKKCGRLHSEKIDAEKLEVPNDVENVTGKQEQRELKTGVDPSSNTAHQVEGIQGQGCRCQSLSNGDDNWRGSTPAKTPRRSREVLGLRRRRKEFERKCFIESKYSSTSEEEDERITASGGEESPAGGDTHPNFQRSRSFAIRNPCRRIGSLREHNLVPKIQKKPVIRAPNDSDFGYRDYDTCVDDSEGEGSLGSDSGSSSRYGGGITSNLSLFSSDDSGQEIRTGTTNDWDSDGIQKDKIWSQESRLKGLDGETYCNETGEESLNKRRKSLDSIECQVKNVENTNKDSSPDQTILTTLTSSIEDKETGVETQNNNYLSNLIAPRTHSSRVEKDKSSNFFTYHKNVDEESFNLHNRNIFRNSPSPFYNLTVDFNKKSRAKQFQMQLQKVFYTLKEEVVDLSSKLEAVSKERDLFENSLAAARLSQIQNERETCSRLDGVTQQYEERLTELHSVIAELTRKLDRQNDDIIIEEEEEDLEEPKEHRRKKDKQNGDEDKKSISEFSSKEQNETTEYSTSETADSEALFDPEVPSDVNNHRPYTDASTSCEMDDRAVEAGECIADLDVSVCKATSDNSNLCNDNATDDAICHGSSSVGLEEEIKILREEKSSLTQALAVAQHNISSQRTIMLSLTRECEALGNKLKEYQRMQPAIPISTTHISDARTVRGLRQSPIFGVLGNSSVGGQQESSRGVNSSISLSMRGLNDETNQLSSNDDFQVICKLAERVRLKKAISGDQRVTGSDLCNVGIYTTGVAEQLAASLQEESDAQELFHALATAGGAFAPHERLKECELEAERLHSRIDHLKAQNDVLGATLLESKAHCDRLALMTGKAEAQTGALKMGVEVLDQIQEAYEVLSALQEAQICFLIATCRMAGVQLETERSISEIREDIGMDPLGDLKRAQEQRRTAENVTRHLLSRLESGKSKLTNGASESDGNLVSIDVSCERKIRNAIQSLLEERTRILSCLQGMADLSPTEEYFPPTFPLSVEEAHKLDLENAVLMQELTAIREDRAELRAQVYLLEREKAGLELRTGTCEAQTAAYCITIDHLKEELNNSRAVNSQESTGDSGVESSSCEAESLRREKQLKARVEDLVTTLDTITKNSEARHRQSQEFISDLKKANSALLTAVDRLKKKYSLRVKRMEQQAISMVEKHAQDMKMLKHRIDVLEDQLCSQANLQQSTTSETSF